MLKKYHPIYVNTHFNHPWEITPESTKACEMLVNAGVVVGNQSVLMKGVNDNAEVMRELLIKLLKIRVKPYYLFMADETKGATHFRTSIDTGMEIIYKLRGHISGLAIPHFVIDAPGGGGKIPILPQYVLHRDEDRIVMRNYKNEVFVYRDVKENKDSGNKIPIEISDKKNGETKSPKNFKDITEIKMTEFISSNN
jgi:lysine 2,3-aminomutase